MQLFLPKYEVEECLEGLRKVLESGWTGAGPVSRQFEEDFATYVGGKYAHFMNSATAALHIALRLHDLPKGSPVLTTPLTFVSTNAVILYEDMKPVFVDINDTDLSLDAEDFLRKQEETNAKSAIWVHYAGNVSPHFYKVMDTLDKHSFSLIEDCAHASGAKYKDGKPVGSRDDTISCFSFHSVKNLPTFDSGMLVTSSKTCIDRAKKLSWLGIDKDTFSRTSAQQNELYKWRYDVPELGWKYNGNDVAATIGKVQLKYLDRDNARRKELYGLYTNYLKRCSNVQIVPFQEGSSHHLVVIRVKNRDEVIQALKDAGIAPGVHYLPNNEFPVFQKFYRKGDCPNAERISAEIVSLPNHLRLTQNDIERVSEIVEKTAKS